jgi:pyridoxine/pyridoxamine 5'-phosphate oxidase
MFISEMEFWLGKPSRLHDRVRYTRVEGSADDEPEWTIERLSP